MKSAIRIIALVASLAALPVLAVPAQAGMLVDCLQYFDPKLGIRGCTAMIRSGQFKGKDLSFYYFSRGIAYDNLGDHRRAIEDFDQALRLDPGFALAYKNRGLAYGLLGEYRRAIEDYDEALRLDPDDAKAYNNRGIAYVRLGEHRRAIEDYDQALRIDPGYAEAYRNRSIGRCRLGQVEASLDDRMQALRLGAFTAEAMQSFLRDRGFYKGAIDGDFGPASKKALREWTAAGCPGL